MKLIYSVEGEHKSLYSIYFIAEISFIVQFPLIICPFGKKNGSLYCQTVSSGKHVRHLIKGIDIIIFSCL